MSTLMGRMGTAARTVEDIMTDTLVVLQEDETLDDLADNMERFSLRHLPVLDDNRLVGLVTHRDVLRAAVLTARCSKDDPPLRVREIMSQEMVTVHGSMPLADAADVLLEKRASCLLVVDPAGALVGIVTEHDFLRLARSMLPSAG